MGRGRSSPHVRVKTASDPDGCPKLQADYMFVRMVFEPKVVPVLGLVETKSGCVISVLCDRKGSYDKLVAYIVRHLERLGFGVRLILQCDKEPAIIDL